MAKRKLQKSFWKKPEGVLGAIVLGGLVIGTGILVSSVFGALASFAASPIGLGVSLLVLGAIIFLAIDKKSRTLISYMYKSAMRWITGLFIEMDPIAILRGYVDDLKSNLRKMNRQVTQLRGQMHMLKEQMLNNQKEIQSNLEMASKARDNDQQKAMILGSRKAARLQESNAKLANLYQRMEVMYRVLFKMHENSEIMMEDIVDQVEVKEQERKAIRASHGAMKSAMSIISGDSDKRRMFDEALEAIADDVSQKVGEMEQFMDMSEGFMNSIDLQNGVFEEKGLQMLEEWEKQGDSLLLGEYKSTLLEEAKDDNNVLDLDSPITKPEPVKARGGKRGNQYDSLFD